MTAVAICSLPLVRVRLHRSLKIGQGGWKQKLNPTTWKNSTPQVAHPFLKVPNLLNQSKPHRIGIVPSDVSAPVFLGPLAFKYLIILSLRESHNDPRLQQRLSLGKRCSLAKEHHKTAVTYLAQSLVAANHWIPHLRA
jgi:hypothetical protein